MKMNMNLGFSQLIINECLKFGCLRNQAAYILATAYHETAHTMKPVVEAYWLSEQWRKSNLRYYPYHGRGFVQLTWKENYIRAGKELGLDFLKSPDQLLEPKNSARILVTGSMEGWFTSKKIGDYVTLQKSNFKGARRVINGTDKANEIARLAIKYDAALKATGYGVDQVVTPDVVAVPVVPQGLDKSMLKSKTNWISTILGGATSVGSFFVGLNPYIQATILLLVAVGVVFLIYERKRYRDEARAIKAGI